MRAASAPMLTAIFADSFIFFCLQVKWLRRQGRLGQEKKAPKKEAFAHGQNIHTYIIYVLCVNVNR